VRNNDRYSAFSPAVTQAFLEVSDLRYHFFTFTFTRFTVVYILKRGTVYGRTAYPWTIGHGCMAPMSYYCKLEKKRTRVVADSIARRDHRNSKFGFRYDIKLTQLYVVTKFEF
jgi:hypothetical protein